MKPLISFVMLWLAVGPVARAQERPSRIVPPAFDSRAAAESYVKGLFAGGTCDVLMAGKREVLVVSVHGSGVPVIAIAAYRLVEGKWSLASVCRPNLDDTHQVGVVEGDVVITVTKGGQKWVLLGANEERRPPLLAAVEPRHEAAAAKVAAALRVQGEDPAEFYAAVSEENAGATLVFSLSHKNAYLLENRYRAGNPSGKDRRIEYDVRSATVTRTSTYQ